MIDRPDFSTISFLHTLWKRKLIVLTMWGIGTVAGVAVAYRLPPIYRAEALILVESQRIPERYVSTTVNADIQDRLNTISQQILSSSRLLEIIDQFDLYRELRNTRPEEETIRQMRDDIGIKMENRSVRDRPGAFRVGYQGPDPGVVTRVANHIGGLFIDENIRTRQVQAEGTSQFLENQLAIAKDRLEQQEARLSEYKLKYNGELPQQERTLIAVVGQMQVQLQGVHDAINRAEQQKVTLEHALESATGSLEALIQTEALAGAAESAAVSTAATPPLPPKRSEQLRAEVDALRLRYKADHPDVRIAEAELARTLRTEVSEVRSIATALNGSRTATTVQRETVEAPLKGQISQTLIRERERVENLRAQLLATNKQLETLNADRRRILKDISTYQARIERLPIREQQLATVARDYEISKASYQSLLDRKLAANVAADMERHQQPERFRMLDPARVPETPVKPNRPVLIALGCSVGLFLGVAVAVGAQLKQNVVLGEWELPPTTWILGRVPLIIPGVPDPERLDSMAAHRGVEKTERWRRVLVLSSVILVLVTTIAAGMFFGLLEGQTIWKEFSGH